VIDTIRFKIPISEEFFIIVKNKCVEFQKLDKKTSSVFFKFYTDNVSLGSFDSSVNFFIDDFNQDVIFLELSLPKFFYGNNVYLLTNDNFNKVFDLLYTSLVSYFGDFPKLRVWEIQRLDLCYAWRFASELQASQVLDVLRSYSYPRKKVYFYDTSIMAKGTTFTLKFYLKYPEFKKHDFSKMAHKSPSHAHDILDLSKGVLRFEITFRKKAFLNYFGKQHLFINDLDYNQFIMILSDTMNKFLKGSVPEFQTATEIFQKLLLKYNNIRALHLWQFYCIYYDKNLDQKKILIENYTRQSVYLNLKALSRAGVGLPKHSELDVRLDIPSKLQVN